jgi:hypothetical protein
MKGNKIYIERLLDCLYKEGFEEDIFEFAIWKLVCSNLHLKNHKLQYAACIEKCKSEIKKWITVDMLNETYRNNKNNEENK